MINVKAVKETIERRLRAFDDERDVADTVAREMFLFDEMDEVLAVAREVVAQRNQESQATCDRR
jgi:hypothetical protein